MPPVVGVDLALWCAAAGFVADWNLPLDYAGNR
uniref:Uncharacterized protein n=1 Tax=Serratia phage Spe5P4 TaxID=3159438 RepID=A0AAU7VH43_9CAUD